MPRRWEGFPHNPWPPGFGFREYKRARPPINPDQLELSHQLILPDRPQPALLEQLRAIIVRSELTMMEFASWVMGCSDVTLYRYLRGSKIPEDRRNWLRRLESVNLDGDRVVTVVQRGAASRRRWPRKRWSYPPRINSGMADGGGPQ